MSDETRESGESLKEVIATPVEDISVDNILELISHQRRRAILELLLTHDRPLTITDLRNEVVEKEQDTEITEISNEQVKRVHISLHHVHIPNLEEKGVVYYDSDRNLVEPTGTISNWNRSSTNYESLVDTSDYVFFMSDLPSVFQERHA